MALLWLALLAATTTAYDSTELSAFTSYRNAAISWTTTPSSCLKFINSVVNDTRNGGGLWLTFATRGSASCCKLYSYFCSEVIVVGGGASRKIPPAVTASSIQYTDLPGDQGGMVPVSILANASPLYAGEPINGCQLVANTTTWAQFVAPNYPQFQPFDQFPDMAPGRAPATPATQCSPKAGCACSGASRREEAHGDRDQSVDLVETTAFPPLEELAQAYSLDDLPAWWRNTWIGTHLCAENVRRSAAASSACFNRMMEIDNRQLIASCKRKGPFSCRA